MLKQTIKVQAFIWLFAMSLNAVAALTVSAAPTTPSNFVYCPLTNRLQPIKSEPPRVSTSDEICAPASEKLKFADLLLARGASAATVGDKQLGNLFFDYSRTGRVTLDTLPPTPGAPANTFATAERPLTTSVRRGFGVVKILAERFAVGIQPRAPAADAPIPHATATVVPPTAMLRRIAPRGPPALL